MNEQKIMTCPECGDTLLCTEDRGIHCDGCGFSTDDNTFILDRMREAMARLEGYWARTGMEDMEGVWRWYGGSEEVGACRAMEGYGGVWRGYPASDQLLLL